MKFSTKGMVVIVLVVICMFLLALADRLTKPIVDTWKRNAPKVDLVQGVTPPPLNLYVAPPPGVPKSKDGLVPPPPPVVPQ